MIVQVTTDNLEELVARYKSERGGENNEDTDSEVVFVLSPRFSGVYVLHHGYCRPIWVGLQNATARVTRGGSGTPFASVSAALEWTLRGSLDAVFYTDDSVERLNWLAARIKDFKAENISLVLGGSTPL